MKEIHDILQAWEVARTTRKRTALATVVYLEGSAYRRPGARMLVTEDGQLTGAISGGCLEGDALRKAQLAMAQQRPVLVKYDTNDEDDAQLGVGLGCNGIIHILIEPLDETAALHPLHLLHVWAEKRQRGVLVTLFSLENRKGEQPGTCFLLTENGQHLTQGTPDLFQKKWLEAATLALQNGQPVWHQEDGLTAFVEVLEPPVSLVVFGAGNDVMPLVNMAALLGWPVAVVDGRANYATAARFPSATQVLVAKPEAALKNLRPDERTAIVLMTHNYNYDLAMLRPLLSLDLPYLGVLGPKKKMVRMLEELTESGLALSENHLHKLHGPVGLDLGAETPEEIALSILAEIQAVMAGSSAGFLREKQAGIHDREIEKL